MTLSPLSRNEFIQESICILYNVPSSFTEVKTQTSQKPKRGPARNRNHNLDRGQPFTLPIPNEFVRYQNLSQFQIRPKSGVIVQMTQVHS